MTVVLVPSSPMAKVIGKAGPNGESHVPLGLLNLATILKSASIEVEIYPLEVSGSTRPCAQRTAEAILRSEPQWIGLSTMCSSYPLSLVIAQECKRLAPRVPIVLGGAQASIVAAETLAEFDFVDFVAQGEYEQSILTLHEAIGGMRPLRDVPNLSYRSHGKVMRNMTQDDLVPLENLPFPDYGLVPSVRNLRSVPIEAGRGCPFACTFAQLTPIGGELIDCTQRNVWLN